MRHVVSVDFTRCESNAVCLSVAPMIFAMDDDDRLFLLEEEIGDHTLAEAAREAERMCPVRAIQIISTHE